MQKKQLEEQAAEIKKLKDQLQKAGIALAKDTANEVKKNTETVAEKMQKIFGNAFGNIGDLFTKFTESLNKLKSGDLKSWEDWATGIGGVVQTAITAATEINDKYFEYKAAALETDKQRELTAAGENAEAREAVTQKYAQKELDLKKKQSSADTVLKVAQAMTAGALAIVQAFAQLGPVGGAIASVLVGSITGLQVATILKQNAAIQATTLDSTVSGSPEIGTGNAPSGALVANQAADGRWDVIGADDGRVYRNVPYRGIARTGIITVPTLMGEAGDEAVIDNPTLRNIRMNAPWVLDTIRQLRVPQRADGNYSNIPAGKNINQNNQVNSADSVVSMNIKVMERLIVMIQWMIDNGIDANVYLDKLERKIELKNKSLGKGSLG